MMDTVDPQVVEYALARKRLNCIARDESPGLNKPNGICHVKYAEYTETREWD